MRNLRIEHIMSGLGAITLLGGIALSPTAASAATPRVGVTFTVNSIADRADVARNGVCKTSVAAECTLRAAIQEADAAKAAVTIAFKIPGTGVHKIAPATLLPAIANPRFGITIDGFTQPGSTPNTNATADTAVRKIEIAGKGPSGMDGLVISTAGNTIRGLDIHGFKHTIWMHQTSSASNRIVGNLVGLLPNGAYDPTAHLVAGSSCIVLQGGAHDNVIGTPALGDRNTIGGCAHQGIAFYNSPTTRTVIQNNIIGLDPTGTQRRKNQSHGIDVNTGTTYTFIGGTGLREHNVISGNFQTGVEISHIPATSHNFVIGNYIGTNLTATAVNANTANGQFGVNLEGRGTCNNTVCPSDAHDNVVSQNVIVNSGAGGIMIDKGQHDNTVNNNLIGVLPNHKPAPNKGFGIHIEAGAFSNTIGPGNEIAYNTHGIQIQATGTTPPDATPSPTNFNRFTQNSIHDTPGLAIDLAPYGTANTKTGDPNVNEGVLTPVLQGATHTSITIKTCAGCTIELFVSSLAARQAGQGKTYLKSGVANASGTLVLSVPAAAAGHAVTATATTPKFSTSEFAVGVAIP